LQNLNGDYVKPSAESFAASASSISSVPAARCKKKETERKKERKKQKERKKEKTNRKKEKEIIT